MYALLLVLALQVVTYPPTPVALNAADVRSANVTLNTTGDGTWTFDTPFAGVPDVTHLPKAVDTVNPVICNTTSITTTSVTLHCWRTNTLGLLSSLLGGPIAGARVNLIARYKAP